MVGKNRKDIENTLNKRQETIFPRVATLQTSKRQTIDTTGEIHSSKSLLLLRTEALNSNA